MPSINRRVCPIHGVYTTGRCGECKTSSNKSYDKYSRDEDSKKLYHSTAWKKVREKALMRDGGLCVECGHIANVVDHIKEVKDGGEKLSLNNLQSLCHAHHNAKTAEERKKREAGGGV